MDYVRITSIEDPLFARLHKLLGDIFPPEEVLEFSLWEGPLADPGIRVFAAVVEGEVVGATEYRYYPDWNIAMTDFTIIGKSGHGIGRFLAKKREEDLNRLAAGYGKELFGMFAEIYDPYEREDFEFGGVMAMNPYVRREVLSHLGYRRLDFPYVHPSWKNDGEAVEGLDFCFMPTDDSVMEIQASIIIDFLREYYSVLPNKPVRWIEMVEGLAEKGSIRLLPL